MARPGFNCTPWLTMPYEEGVLMALLGQYPTGHVPMEKFHQHMEHYSPNAIPFYKLTDEEVNEIHPRMNTVEGLRGILENVKKKTKIIGDFNVSKDGIEIQYCGSRLEEEISFLKSSGVDTIVSLTEDHHNTPELSKTFDLIHLSIRDLNAPKKEQAEELANIFKSNFKNEKVTAVHCLAGIGRTSTMIMAAHMIMGESLEDLKVLLAEKNPYYKFTGSQAQFLDDIEKSL